MGDKKHIDQFFKEQFKDFEVAPPDSAWSNINNELGQESGIKKRILPFWLQLGGIAASVVILIMIGISQLDSVVPVEQLNIEEIVEQSISPNELLNDAKSKLKSSQNKSVLATEIHANSNVRVNNKTGLEALKNNRFEVNNDVVLKANEAITSSQKVVSETPNTFSKKQNSFYDNKEGDDMTVTEVITTKLTENTPLNKENEFVKFEAEVEQSFSNATVISANAKSVVKETVLEHKNEYALDVDRMNEVLVVSNDVAKSPKNEQNLNDKEVVVAELSSLESIHHLKKEKESSVVNSDTKNTTILKTEQMLVSASNTSESELLTQNLGENTLVTENTLDENNGVAEDDCVTEEVLEELPVEQTIEEAIAEQELKKEDDLETATTEGVYKKWKIAPNVAPVYYNSLTAGSPISEDFKNNKKKGQFTTSYGIGVGYALNKRLSVRTGINRLEVGYDTEDVAVYSSPESTGDNHYKNITFSSQGSGMSIASSGTYSTSQIPAAFSSLFDSSINQRFGYLEVPLEVSYKLSDKKLRVDVIAGLSAFFLNKNEIYSENKVKTIYLGEANNLNKMSYSTNLGLGLEYKISKSINFNFDPMFKYQLNAFSNDSGNFKPYILGVYSGLSYRF